MKLCRSLLPGALFTLTFWIHGCGSSPPARFYLLSPMAGEKPEEPAKGDAKQVAIRVRPTELPEYLNRPQIVTRTEGNLIELAEYDRWAEPLQSTFMRVLLTNLARHFPGGDHSTFFLDRTLPADYEIGVTVIRFDIEGGDRREAVLEARWLLYAGADRDLIHSQYARLRRPVEGDDYAAAVRGLSRVISDLGQTIAAKIDEVAGAGN